MVFQIHGQNSDDAMMLFPSCPVKETIPNLLNRWWFFWINRHFALGLFPRKQILIDSYKLQRHVLGVHVKW
jgi:hypothetical protein